MVALEKEAKEIRDTHRSQIKTFLEKAENDDRFIDELKNEIERLRKVKGMTRLEPINNNKEASELKWQVANLHSNISKLQKELNEKISEVKKLSEKKITKAKEAYLEEMEDIEMMS